MIKHFIDKPIVEPKFPVNQIGTDLFLSSGSDHCRFVVGRNEVSRDLSEKLKVTAFIDDFYVGDRWSGIPVIRSANVPSKSVLLNCSSSIYPLTVESKFGQNGHKVIGYYGLNKQYPDLFRLPAFASETREDYRQNIEQWDLLFTNLADETSKKVLVDLLKYRLSGDYNYMSDYSVRVHQQYFERFMAYDAECFVDAGGYDGDTSAEFIRRCPNFKHIYIFEPSPANLSAATQRLSDSALKDKIDFIPYGLSNESGKLAFDPEQGSSSSVLDTGEFMIDVTTLDEYIDEKISFIKMDIEGWELQALEGAKQHIRKCHPKLAIAVYHHPSHFWQVFNLIREIRNDYQIYLRHYTEGWSETVMYFKPK